MQTQQQRDSGLQSEARSTKKGIDSNISAANTAAAEEPFIDEPAADASKEAAAELLSEKPMQHRHEKHLENERKEQEQQMLQLGRTEKEGQRNRIMAHSQLQEPEVTEQPTAHLFEKKQEQPREFLGELPGRREDLGSKIEAEKQDLETQPLQQEQEQSKKKQHKKLSSRQLQQQQQELEETENVHQSQKREALEPNSPSSTSTDSADKEHREPLRGQEAIGDVHAKQTAHGKPHHKKQYDRTAVGEEPHLTKQQLQQHEQKEQQAGSHGGRKQRKEIRHHNKPERENPREASPASTTSSSTSGSEEVAHGRFHELVNKDMPRDKIHHQEKLHESQPLGTLQENQARMNELPTKEKQSEGEKEMSTRLGAQLPLKQEPTGQQTKEASKLTPSQKKDFAPAQ